MTMKQTHAVWHAIAQCIVATNNAEDEGVEFCPWKPGMHPLERKLWYC